jgi:hypothetical protein
MRVVGTRRVAWGELALVTALAALALAYLVDARSVSLSMNNLLLLQPTAVLVLVLWAIIAWDCVSRPAAAPPPAQGSRAQRARPLVMVVAFGLFIASLERVGYDIAIAAFVAAGLVIGGERRPHVVVPFALVFAALVMLGFRALVPYPFPTTLL